ncbi:TfoX/Sxy family protein [Arthrobacter sp. LS16]|uniref:TfoX/Sxy family protein n=1 Tax=Arthrobacter sp. 'calajunan' TaxID=1690248 RepID=UPI003C768396
MTPEQTVIVQRIRSLLADEPELREVSMFGGRSIMVNGKMVVSVRKGGTLLVRVNTDQLEEYLERPEATKALMGSGREMAPGWIEIAADALSEGGPLSFWVGAAMDYNRFVARGKP